MNSSLEIAQEAELLAIEEIAERCGLEQDEFEPYGRHKAKISLSVTRAPRRCRPTAKIVCVAGDDADEGGRGQDDDARSA